jgi:hypothetical protein
MVTPLITPSLTASGVPGSASFALASAIEIAGHAGLPSAAIFSSNIFFPRNQS